MCSVSFPRVGASSALVSWWINTVAEHGKCGRATKVGPPHLVTGATSDQVVFCSNGAVANGTHDICHAHNTRNFTSQEPEAATILSLTHLLSAQGLKELEGKICPLW